MDEKYYNIQAEIFLVGSFYKEPDLYIKHGNFIKEKYDLSDTATRFFYTMFVLMYQTFTTDISDINIVAFATQDSDRESEFNTYGGIKTIKEWQKLANIKDFANYYDLVKKYSLLRAYKSAGFDTDKLISQEKFDKYKAIDIDRYVRYKQDNIRTVILADEDAKDISQGVTELINSSLEIADMGVPLPYNIITNSIRGIRLETFGVTGMLSNDGKTRYLAKLVSYLAFIQDKKTVVMLNETTEKEFKLCLITTVINNPEFQALHKVQLTKKEREIAMGLFRDNKGEFITRKTDDTGLYKETTEEYKKRISDNSSEYLNVLQIAQWLEEQMKNKLLVKVLKKYDDSTLKFEITKYYKSKGIQYFAYDTIKSDLNSIGDWSSLKKTCTVLSELAKDLKVAIYGSIQLTDDAEYLNPLQLSSNNIANAKQLKHVVDYLFLAKSIPKDKYNLYEVNYIGDDWGTIKHKSLDNSKTYYGFKTDKNRAGDKPILCFEVDLDTNVWTEIGWLKQKSTGI